MWKRKRVGVAILAAGAISALTWHAAGPRWRAGPPAAVADSGEPATPEPAVVGKGIPLDCRLVPLSPERRRAKLAAEGPWLRERQTLAGPRLSDNPLVARSAWFEVEIENTSARDLAVCTNHKELFWARAEVKDVTGRPLPVKEVRSTSSLKRLGGFIPGLPGARTEVLRPGQVVTLPVCLYFAGLDCEPRAGRYRVRAICEYCRGSDWEDRRVESPSLVVTVTEAHVRGWKALYD